MSRHLHSRSLSRNIACPESSVAWGLPTPPPSLSDLSTLARAEYPPPKITQFGGGRSTQESGPPISRDQREDECGLLPLPYASPSHLNSIESPAPLWMGPWFNRIASLRRTAARSFRLFSATDTIRSRLAGLGSSVGTWLTLYLICNLALTLYNKYLLNVLPFPWLLTALHAFCAALGSGICAWQGVFKPAPLDHPTTPLLALFSVLYSANIAASNASLQLVSIATHQVVRAATPLFVVLFAWIGQVGLHAPGLGFHSAYRARQRTGYLGITSAKLKSLTPVVLGVVFATYGDYSYTRSGLALTLVGTALAALKTMLASRVVRPKTHISSLLHAEPTQLPNPAPLKKPAHTAYGYARRASLKRVIDEEHLSGDDARTLSSAPLHPLDVLLRLSPLACIQCLIMAFVSGETRRWSSIQTQPTLIGWQVLALNGALAFLLNYVSFVANRRAGALSMTVVANVKQVLTILLALVVFNTGTPSAMHLVGIGLTLAGGVWYGYLEVKEKYEREEGQEPNV